MSDSVPTSQKTYKPFVSVFLVGLNNVFNCRDRYRWLWWSFQQLRKLLLEIIHRIPTNDHLRQFVKSILALMFKLLQARRPRGVGQPIARFPLEGIKKHQKIMWCAILSKLCIYLEYCSRGKAVNYRPSAPFLYEVASRVKNCHFGDCYYILLLLWLFWMVAKLPPTAQSLKVC